MMSCVFLTELLFTSHVHDVCVAYVFFTLFLNREMMVLSVMHYHIVDFPVIQTTGDSLVCHTDLLKLSFNRI